MKCRPPVGLRRGPVRTRLQQQLREVGAPLARGEVDRRDARARVHDARARAALEQQPCNGQVALLRRDVEKSPTVRCTGARPWRVERAAHRLPRRHARAARGVGERALVHRGEQRRHARRVAPLGRSEERAVQFGGLAANAAACTPRAPKALRGRAAAAPALLEGRPVLAAFGARRAAPFRLPAPRVRRDRFVNAKGAR